MGPCRLHGGIDRNPSQFTEDLLVGGVKPNERIFITAAIRMARHALARKASFASSSVQPLGIPSV